MKGLLENLRDVVGVPDPEADATLERWKASGTPCFWCWLGDKPREDGEYDGESLAGLHVITGDKKGAPGVLIAGCRTAA